MKIGEDIHIMATSDIHGILPEIPNCDILCIAGDITPVGESHFPYHQLQWFNNVFVPWVESLDMDVVLTPGNHDFCFEKTSRRDWKIPKNLHVLIDQECEVRGVRFFGSPWCPVLRNWAFYKDDAGLKRAYSRIPDGIDVLLSHSPPTVRGATVDSEMDDWDGTPIHFGMDTLTQEILRSKPKFVICGHIHNGSHDPVFVGEAVVMNVSLLDKLYRVAYPIVELKGIQHADSV